MTRQSNAISLARREKESIWPPFAETDPHVGQSDEVLESLCVDGTTDYDRTLGWRSAPWLFWTTELYSFGRCYREWLNWPRWLPIPAYGDHGVCITGTLYEHELINPARLHLTWYKARYEEISKCRRKRVARIPHPWILYRQRHGIKIDPNAIGTLIFFSHSVDGIEIEGYDLDRYIESLGNLPATFKPLTICMHMHDVRKGYHKKLRKYGLPVVTAGDTSSPFFVDRFYDVIRRFKYATSNIGGSDLFYCTELGVKYFVFGEPPVYVNRGHGQLPVGELKARDSVAQLASRIKKDLFSEMPPNVDERKMHFVNEVLGLDIDRRAARSAIRRLFVVEMIRMAPRYFAQLTVGVIGGIRRKGLRNILVKIFGLVR